MENSSHGQHDMTTTDREITDHYDLFVIGGGSGGVRAARWAASRGLKVGIAEGDRFGGTCVNVGCVPKKLFYHAAHISEVLHDAEGFGWKLEGAATHDWQQLTEGIERYIKRLNGIYERLLDQSGVIRYRGWARLVSAHTIEVQLVDHAEQVAGDRQGSRMMIKADQILLAPGGRPALPDIPGISLTQDSNDFFALKEAPRRAVVVGGGYIGVELAGALSGLGVDTTLVYRRELPLRGFDEDIRRKLSGYLAEQMTVRSGAELLRVEGDRIGVKSVYLSDSEDPIEAEFVLVATGRVPNIEQLNLGSVGIELDPEGGGIRVDDEYRTSLPHIFAVGDVINRLQLTPVALAEAMRVVGTLTGKALPPLNYDLVPTTVFSHPNVGQVGLTEEAAKQRGKEVIVYETDFKPLQQALSKDPKRVYMKLVICAQSDRVLGCHMMGDDAGEQIQGLAAAMQANITKAQLDQTIGIHPTMAEEWVTMRTARR